MSCSTPSSGPGKGSVKGYLDVKIPARKRKSISLFRVQVWKRRCWVVVRGDRSPADSTSGGGMVTPTAPSTPTHPSSTPINGNSSQSASGEISLSVEIYTRHEGSNQPTEGTILHIDLVHKIRRAKSKSHPYAFEVCGRRGQALLYLSGGSETESQRWMSAMRDLLWLPLQLPHINAVYPHNWPVSAISVGEEEGEYAALGGLYGRMAVARANLVIKDVHNGATLAEWPLTSIQRVYVSAGGELEDEGKIFIIQTRPAHPCGETYLYFFSNELGPLLDGLHDAVSGLLAKGNGGDDTSVISDLSELSGAIGSVVVQPQRLPELGTMAKVRKSTSVLDLSEVSSHKIGSDLLGVPTCKSLGTSPQHKMLSHCRRKSMSETNLARICLDETDEELDARDEDLDDIRPADQPKDRTSSSGSYNSYRSTDSGVRLSASPSNYDQATMRRLVTKSDSIDSGVRACIKDDAHKDHTHLRAGIPVPAAPELDDTRKVDGSYNDSKSGESSNRSIGTQEEEPDVNARVGAWCLQSAKARKSFFLKNLNAATIPSNRDKFLTKSLSRTLSESYKEIPERGGVKEEYRKAMENPILTTKHTTVYEEIKDVLKPLNEKRNEKEHEYEDLEKLRRDIKRSYSFQEKTQPPPPPLPPRRPKSFSPDPWVEGSLSKTGTLRKIFGLSFHSKSHSQDSMLEMEAPQLGDDRLHASHLESCDVATVQALGTLPRPRRRATMDVYERHQSFSSSPRMSPKQKIRNPFGISPSRSPRIPRPKNLFIFKTSNNDENSSPSSQANLRYQRQIMMQSQKTPSTDSSLADISTPDTPKPGSFYRGMYRPDSVHLETPDTGDESGTKDGNSGYNIKSPKIMSKTFSFLRKYPKEKYGSLEQKRKSTISVTSQPDSADSSNKVPNSFSLDSFAVDAEATKPEDEANKPNENCSRKIEGRKASVSKGSSGIMIPRGSYAERGSSVSPATTPSGIQASCLLGRPGTPPATDLPLRSANRQPSASSIWNVPGIPPQVPPKKCNDSEPQYANLGPDPDYMTVEEIAGAFRKTTPTLPSKDIIDPGGYLSMGDIRQLKAMPETNQARPPDHEYVSMDDIQTTTFSDYPKVCGSATSSMDRRQTHHHHPHHHPYVSQLRQMHQPLDKSSIRSAGPGSTAVPPIDFKYPHSLTSIHKSAPGSRKTSCCEGIPSDYLTPQEVGRLLRRELLHTATSRTRQEHERSHAAHKHALP
ncbi:uncharacterized protein LOC108675566 [Hyalella azteca]|uniref:Uncharacterized protein LOC108675566 n=1 Tax=Hyalella azteca TaxID=294128 RepID=A0A8B7NZA3_HYAAZ|nr:uncharacterized protein LOC108675566 [Hyalella azteca]